MRDKDQLFRQLTRSKFRSSFQLRKKESDYLRRKALPAILSHARDFIDQRLAPARPKNDGRQTPMKNHPVFIAQHATATCCRNCLSKWHNIPKERPLTKEEIEYIISVIEQWLKNQYEVFADSPLSENTKSPQKQQTDKLF